MYRLIIFALVMLALAGICNGQGRSHFGAYRAQDTSYSEGQLKLSSYTSSDTGALVIAPNGDVKRTGRPISADSSIFVTTTRLEDSLDNYERILDWTKRIEATNTEKLQGAINDLMGVVETSYTDATGAVTVDSIAPPQSGKWVIYTPYGEWDFNRGIVSTVNGRRVDAQIYIPLNYYTPNNPPVSIEFRSSMPPPMIGGVLVNGYEDGFNRGAIWKSTVNNRGGTHEVFIGCVAGDTILPFGIPYNPNNVEVHFKNTWIRVNHDPTTGVQIGGINLNRTFGYMTIDACRIDCDTDFIYTVAPTKNVYGVRLGNVGSGMLQVVRNTLVGAGFTWGIVAEEHAILDNTQVVACQTAFSLGSAAYPIEFRNPAAHWCKTTISTNDFNAIDGDIHIEGSIRIEQVTSGSNWWIRDTTIKDASNRLMGTLRFTNGNNGVKSESLLYSGAQYLQTEYAYDRSFTGALLKYLNRHSIYGGLWLQSTSLTGEADLIVQGNRGGFTSTGIVGYGSSGKTSTIGGVNIADVFYSVSLGTFSRGYIFGTQTSDSLRAITNNIVRGWFMPTGGFGLSGKITTYNNAAPTNGQLLIGNTAGTFDAATLTAGAGISVTNGAGSITLAAIETVVNTAAGTLSPAINTHYFFTGTTSTWTLPVVGANGSYIRVKNVGTGAVTINSNSGGNDIFTSSAVNTTSVPVGSFIELKSNGTYWGVE